MSGYNAGNVAPTLAESSSGKFTCTAAAIAQSYETAIAYGYPERDGN